MRINTNIASLNAQANNAQTNMTLQNSLEKLSSGLKINRAADDASGMAIADKLRTQASSIGQGIQNANSGSALIQIADKAMAEQSNVLDIVKTKLLQAATSTTSEEGREAIRKDITKLLDQVNNISLQTTYNGVNLLNEKGADFNFQVGEKSTDIVGLKTEFAVNTDGLGTVKEELTRDVGTVNLVSAAGSTAGSIDGTQNSGVIGNSALTLTKDNMGSITVSSTAGSTIVDASAININSTIQNTGAAVDTAFNISSNKVSTITLANTGAGAGVVDLETSDADLRGRLDAMVATSDNLSKIGEGRYQLTQTAAALTSTTSLTFSDDVDISSLKFSGVATGVINSLGVVTTAAEVVTIVSKDDLTINKLDDNDHLSITAATTAGVADTGVVKIASDDSFDNIKFSAGISLTSGSTSVQVEPGQHNEQNYVEVVAKQLTTVGSSTEIDITVDAKNAESITFKAAGTTTVDIDLSSDDEILNAKLAEMAVYEDTLTANDDGTFTVNGSATGSDAVLDFGDNKINLSNLKFSGVEASSAANNETISIESDDVVTITSHNSDVELNLSSKDSAAAGTQLVGATQDLTVSQTTNLEALRGLSENGLTADKANEFMSVIDDAMTQLNSVRSDFGSTQNQLNSALRNMMVTQVNVKAAESVIRDVDYAAESANFNKQNIIAQAGTYAMSQANQVQQNVMRLLQ